ncbi:MAG: PAS domain S-box protein [Nitrospirales bacterium]
MYSLVNQAVVGMFQSTAEGKLVWVNTVLARLFGYQSPQEMIKFVSDIAIHVYVHPGRREDFCRLFQEKDTVVRFLSEAYCFNNEIIWIEEYARVLRDSSGLVLGYEGVVLDATERQRQEVLVKGFNEDGERAVATRTAELPQVNTQMRQELADSQQTVALLREQLERYHIAAQGSQEGLWEGRPLPGRPWHDPETPAWYSSQFMTLLGYEEHEFPPVLGSWASSLHPEDRGRIFQAMQDHIENHLPYEVESRLKTKQGEYRWFKGKGQAIFDEQGKFIRGGGTIRDITDQKQAEDALKKKHALLTAVVEGTSDIIYVKTKDGMYLLINSAGAKLLGKRIEDVIGLTDADLFPEQPHALFTLQDRELLRDGTSQSFEVDVMDKEAVSRTFLVTKEPVRSEEGEIEGILGMTRDITLRKASELTIQEREKRYRAIMENAYDLIAEVDASAKFLYASPNFQEVLGYPAGELVGSNIFSFVHPEDRSCIIAEFEKGMQERGVGRAIYRYLHKNGEYRWFESTGRAFQTTLGEVRGVVVSRDITDRKKSDEALEAIVKGTCALGSPYFFETLVRELAKILHSPMVFVGERIELSSSRVRVLAFWNEDHLEEGFEYECLGGPCEQVFAGRSVYFSEGIQSIFPKSDRVKSLDIQGYWGTPLFNSNGEVVGSLAVMDRKTLVVQSQEDSLLRVFAARAGAELERKRAQEALQASQDRYRALYDQTPLMYFTVDSNLKVLSVNQFGADLLGYSIQELLGQSVLSVVHPEDHSICQKEIGKRFDTVNQTTQKEFRKVKKDGTILWVRETLRTIIGPNQQKMLLLSGEDVSDRKRAEEALELSEKQLRHTQKMEAIGTLAGGIAHDFNNILGAILGYSELAMAQAPKDQRLRSYLEEVLTAGNRAKELVKQILAFSRRSEQAQEAVDLNDIVREVLQMLRATLPATIEIRSTFEVDSAVVFADPTQIHQVLMNLCANAEYAMRKEGGILDLAVTSLEMTAGLVREFPKLKLGSYVQLTIRDSGQGIPGEALDRIFDPFFTTKEAGEGTGLGLAVVHGIIIGHGGNISVSSVMGQGTTFSILLPGLDVVLPSQTEKEEEWPKGTGRVLFVDDEEVLARWGEQMLTHLGYTVLAKNNPHEALELFRSQPDQFDVVVTDQTMPTMSGEAFALAILDIREDIPIILCTGFSHTTSAERARRLGLRGFLMKPVNGGLLAETLKEIFTERGKKEPNNTFSSS